MCAVRHKTPPEVLSELLQPLVIEVAEREILPRFQHPNVRKKADGSLVTDADLAAQEGIRQGLKSIWPDIPLLGEEMERSEQERILAKGEYWCLDPLDGTTNFTTGIPFFAVSLALIRNGRIVSGVVYDPLRHECFRADRGLGAYLNDTPLSLIDRGRDLSECVALVDFKRLGRDLVVQLASQPPVLP